MGYRTTRRQMKARAADVATRRNNRDDDKWRIIKLEAEVTQLRTALAFAASVIKSGESWSPECAAIIGDAICAATNN